MEMVKVYHPLIDDGKRIVEIPAVSFPHHAMSGWLIYDETPETESSVEEKQPTLPRRSRVITEKGEGK
jgi:hypothetical protein